MLHSQLLLTFGQFGSGETKKKRGDVLGPAHERTVRASVNGQPRRLLASENPTPTETDFPHNYNSIKLQLRIDFMTSKDEAGDYSMIISNVQKKISGHISDNFPSQKRTRLSIDSPTSSPAARYKDVAYLSIANDELKLQNEELREKLSSVTDEKNRDKENLIRQLQFLDNESKQLRQSMSEKSEKYFLSIHHLFNKHLLTVYD